MKTLQFDMPEEFKSMTLEEAYKVAGANQPTWALRNMVKALGMLPFLNTREDWRRKQAATLILRDRRRRRRS